MCSAKRTAGSAMKILALEFSSTERSAAVVDSDATNASAVHELIETAGATDALALIDAALRAAGCEREQIDCIAVGLGPGSYTGVRGAIALAQGWQLARGVKLLGVSSADAIAAQAQAEGISGPVS